MAIAYLTDSDLVVKANDPKYADTKNKAGQYIWAQFIAEHDTAGIHTDRYYAIQGEELTYAGNGSANRTISLSNANVQIALLIIYDDASIAYWHWDSETQGAYYNKDTEVIGTHITDGSTPGEFTVDANLNNGSRDYYVIALGYDVLTTITPGAGGSDPVWVEDGDSTDASTGTGTEDPNKVENHIETQFLVAHNDAGAHTTNPFSGQMAIETGFYDGNGSDDRTVSLSNPRIDIHELIIYLDSSGSPLWYATDVMAADDTKAEDVAATLFLNDYIQDVSTTGEFEVGLALNTNQESFFYIAIGEIA